jgi:hypothetical protein
MSPTSDFSEVSAIFYKRDNEEASCDALQRMSISDVRPQDPSNQPQETSLNDTTPPT